ncbi:MAG: hypothetical protein AUG84_03130 [Chloroflexi bacterium 13_1_20CM_4_66_7]|nr:MAG: hypothetical protein AUG84_03130 [Chloroflexi bacterium 13_1_20CM_4_66_7]
MPLDIRNIHGPLRVLAGPGTGKTHLLVDLYEQAVRSGEADRSQILVLTFSTGAAGELASRIDARLHDDYGEAWISTFHSFCARILRDNAPDRDRLLLNGFQEWIVMRDVLTGLDPALLGPLDGVRRSDAFAHDLLAFVALMKQNLVHPAALQLATEASASERLRVLASVYQAYHRRMREARLFDFRDLISATIELLETNPTLRERLRAKFELVLVDEFQDVDPAQFELLDAGERLLAATQPDRSPRVLRADSTQRVPAVVLAREGDPVDEAFFCAREIKRLQSEWPELRLRDFAIVLRSTSALGAPFEEALRALGLPYEVRGWGATARNEVVRFLVGYLESLRKPDDPDAFESAMTSTLGGVGPHTVSRLRAYAFERSRPLRRVVNSVMYALAARDPERYPLPWAKAPPHSSGGGAEGAGGAVTTAPPPHSWGGGAEGAGGAVTIAPTEPRPEPSFMQFLTAEELDDLYQAMVARERLLGQARRLPIAALAYTVLIEGGAMRRLLDLGLPAVQRAEAIGDLRAAIEGLESIEAVHERLQGAKPLLADITGSLQSLLSTAADDTEAADGLRDAVQIMTVHQAKGLEFEVVFCSGFAHGLFPLEARPHPLLDAEDRAWLEGYKVGFMPSWPSDPDGHLAEEARLAFVAMTRARRRLYITYADAYLRQAGPSVFLGMADPEGPVRELTRSSRLDPEDVLLAREAEVLLASHRALLDDVVLARARTLGLDLPFLTDPSSGEPFESYGPGRNPDSVQIDHFSPTTLNDYLKCPRLYWYNHHPGLVDEPRSVAMERGGFLHEVLQDFHEHEEEWRPHEAEQQREWLEVALQRHLEGYLARMEGVLDRKREEKQVRSLLGNYIRAITGMQFIRRLRTLAVEKRFRLRIDGSDVVGKIDRVNDVGDGEVEVVDYKTGSGKPMRYAYDMYFGPELYDVQLALYYLACKDGVDEEGNPLAFQPRFLSLWYPKDWVWGGMRQDIFSVGRPAGLKEYREKVLSAEDLERSRSVVVTAIERIKGGHFEPAPRELAGTCVTRFGSCPHAAVCPYGGAPPE